MMDPLQIHVEHRLPFRAWLELLQPFQYAGPCDSNCHHVFVLRKGAKVKRYILPKRSYNYNLN